MIRGIALGLLAMALVGCASGPGERQVDAKRAAQTNADMGLRYMQMGKDDVALEKLKRALSFDDESVSAHHYLAELYKRLGENEKADDHYRTAVYLAPDNSEVRHTYAVFLCRHDRFGDAEDEFNATLENPVYQKRSVAFQNFGLCLQKQEKYDRAETYFRKALDLEPRLPYSLWAMADLSFKQGKMLSARAYLQRYSEVARHTPGTLWLGVQVERSLGDRNAVASYGMLLKNKFPRSEEAAKYSRTE